MSITLSGDDRVVEQARKAAQPTGRRQARARRAHLEQPTLVTAMTPSSPRKHAGDGLPAPSARLRVSITPLVLALLLGLEPRPLQAQPAPRIAPPAAGESFDAWCTRLERAEPFVPFRCTRTTDWTEPGHPSRTLRVRWAGSDVAQAFELARRLFDVPATVAPPRTGPREQVIEDPGKPAEVWESTLTVARGADGRLRRASWSQRREGSGRTVTAVRIDARFVEVSEVAFGD